MKKAHPCSSCSKCPFEHHYDLYLKDILLALDFMDWLVEHMGLEAFMHDRTTCSAIIRKFELIKKALKHIPRIFKQHTLTYRGSDWHACEIS